MAREARIEKILAHAVAGYLHQHANKKTLITVLKATLVNKASEVHIFVSVFPKEDAIEALHFLRRKRPEVRAYLQKETSIGRVPTVEFSVEQ